MVSRFYCIVEATSDEGQHYHKAKLFNDEAAMRVIAASSNPGVAKRQGRRVRGFDAKMWEEARVGVVERANRLKFQTGSVSGGPAGSLRAKLLATGNRELVEASPYDKVWGIGMKGDEAMDTPRSEWGQNLLGQVLMTIRAELKFDDEE